MILQAILKLKKEEVSASEILNELHKEHPKYPLNTLTTYLNQLISVEREEILRLNKDADLYFFSNPFLKAYAELAFSKESKPSSIGQNKISADEIRAWLLAKKEMESEFDI